MCQNCSELVFIVDGGENSAENNDLPIGRYEGVPSRLLVSKSMVLKGRIDLHSEFTKYTCQST